MVKVKIEESGANEVKLSCSVQAPPIPLKVTLPKSCPAVVMVCPVEVEAKLMMLVLPEIGSATYVIPAEKVSDP